MDYGFYSLGDPDATAMSILSKRYFHPGEVYWDDVVARVMAHVMGDEPNESYLPMYQMLLNRYFLPNSPVLFNAGKPDAGLSACFVVDMPDDINGIMKTFNDFVMICRKGGGAGVTLSNVRPEGAPVAGSTHGYAGGPVKFYNALCQLMDVMAQSGKRPMAQMGTMSVFNPDIMKFITAKNTEGVMTTTNISVVVNDAFMNAVLADEDYWTEFKGVRYQELSARAVFSAIVEGAWSNGEPGLLFDEKINSGPYAYTGQQIMASNPCGEMPLPPNGACNLGSLDISKFVRDGKLDYDLLRQAINLAVLFLDNVASRSSFPTPEITAWVKDNNPIGLGIMGFADYLLKIGVAYGSKDSLRELDYIMEFMYDVAHKASQELGKKRGYPKECKKLPSARRNITLLTVAPTGTISLIAGCSSGIEPVFSEITVRQDGTGTYHIAHPHASDPHFRCAVAANGAKEVTWQEHLAVQNAAQEHVDSGVSKTINLPHRASRGTIWSAFVAAWKSPYIKGVTVYRNQSRKVEVLTPKNLKKDLCPVCGEALIKESGCTHCSSCDYSLCTV